MAIIKKEAYFNSSTGVDKIRTLIWQDDEVAPVAVFQIAHGVAEHIGRYDHFARFLASNGFIVWGNDHIGHGLSVEDEDDLGFTAEKEGYRRFVDDMHILYSIMHKRYAELPYILFGHSMGSMVVRCYLRENDDKIDKLIVCGSPCNNPLAGTAVLLAKAIRLFRGERHRSKFLSYMSTGKGNAEFVKAGKGSWLTRDEEIASAFRNDAKCRFHFTANGFENLFNLMKFTYQKRGYQVKNPTLPIHFISGTEDAVLGSEKKWKSALAMLEKLGYKQVTGKLYEGMRHEVHNELGREEVYKDILAFIEE